MVSNTVGAGGATDAQTPDTNRPEAQRDDIAIIGIGCRFPGGADGPQSLWRLLSEGVDAVGEVPPDRWDLRDHYAAERDKPGKTYTRWGGFVSGVDTFDAGFFGMSPREARLLDPQQRMLLEVSWEALEDSGQSAPAAAGARTGVFVGGFTLDYMLIQLGDGRHRAVEAHTATGSMMTLLANRLSYVYDLGGPSVTVDTACSSSLVAAHLACQSLRSQECDLALVGGVNAMLRPSYTIAESKAGMLSPTGRSRAFAAAADGYVRGEGAGVVILKRLSQARADGDPIYAVIRGSATNQDGRSQGLTVPSGSAQQAVMRQACEQAAVAPGRLVYVEAHGTGTPVGDPIEANAIGGMVSRGRPADLPCRLGSVKTNIGHTEAAAGIAGLIKTALVLKHGQVPPHLHLDAVNPEIDLEALRLRINTVPEQLPAGEPWFAGVNSFGFGGSNAHVVLQAAESPECPGPQAAHEDLRERVVPLSARSPEALRDLTQAYAEGGAGVLAQAVADTAHTAARRRAEHPYRVGLVAADGASLAQAARLAGSAAGEVSAVTGDHAKPVFVFSGMGPQWWAMGRELMEREPVFRAAVTRVSDAFADVADWSLLSEMEAAESASRMERADVAQPANFALQVGLAELLRNWGVEPGGVVGHSAGEVAAGYVAGALSFEDAVHLIHQRSRLQQTTAGRGRIASVALTPQDCRELVGRYAGRVSLAAVNAPESTGLAGDAEALADIVRELEERGVFCRLLRGDVPYHSHLMEPLREELLACLAGLEPREAQVPLYSTVTGGRLDGAEIDAAYWYRNIREPVLFGPAVQALHADGHRVFVELAPHPVLSAAIGETLAADAPSPTVVPTLRRKEPERVAVLGAVARLYSCGVTPDWEAVNGTGRPVPLPAYPWQRERHWHEDDEAREQRLGRRAHPLLGRRVPGPETAWQGEVGPNHAAYLRDHRVQGSVVFPGAGYVEMAAGAIREAYGPGTRVEFEDVVFEKALFLRDDEVTELRVTLPGDGTSFEVHSSNGGAGARFERHATGSFRPRAAAGPDRFDLERLFDECPQEVPSEDCYTHFTSLGLEYGPLFRGIGRLRKGQDRAVAELDLAEGVREGFADHVVHPVLLDLCFQTMAAALPFTADEGGQVYLPVGVTRGHLSDAPERARYVRAHITAQDEEMLQGDIQLLDEEGVVLAEMLGCRARALRAEQQTGRTSAPQQFYDVSWQPAARAAEETATEETMAEETMAEEAVAEEAVAEEAVAEETATEETVAEEAVAEGTSTAASAGNWLVLTGAHGLGRELAEGLRAQGGHVVEVRPGTGFSRDDDGGGEGDGSHGGGEGPRFAVDPESPDDFARLLREAFPAGTPCHGVLHAWCPQDESPAPPGAATPPGTAAGPSTAALRRDRRLGPIALLHLTRTLAATSYARPPRIWVVTRHAQPVAGTPVLEAGQAMLWGMSQVLGMLENQDLWGGIADLDDEAASTRALLAELTADPVRDRYLAFRAGTRMVPRLRRLARAPRRLPVRCRPDAAYLITGGFGALGLLVAEHLVRAGAHHLVLVGRGGLPDRGTWTEGAHPEPVAARIAAVRRLEALGASVHPVALDVTDEQALHDWHREWRRQARPPVRGVLHAAGVARPQLLVSMDAAEFDAVLAPKTLGALALHHVFADTTLDDFVLFSSVASVVPSTGQGNYAAGNAFLDALAHHRVAHGLPALSIDWGPWGDAGMATRLDLIEYFEKRGFVPMTNRQGLEAFEELLACGAAQATVIAADWPVVGRENFPLGVAPPLLDDVIAEAEAAAGTETATDTEADATARLAAASGSEERREVVFEEVRAVISQVLGTEPAKLTPEASLNDHGVDSMMAIEMKNRISRRLGANVAIVDLLKGLTVAELVDGVHTSLDTATQQDPAKDEVAAILAEARSMSEEELRALRMTLHDESEVVSR